MSTQPDPKKSLVADPDWRRELKDFQRDHWNELRRPSQDYLLALFEMTARGRAAVADLMAGFETAVGTEMFRHSGSPQGVPPLLWRDEIRAHRNMESLHRWIITQLEPDAGGYGAFADLSIADVIFDNLLPELADSLRQDPSADEAFSIYASVIIVVLGVLSDTGAHAAITLLDRHGALSPVTRALRTCRQYDRSRVDTLVPYFARAVAGRPRLADELEARINRAYLLSVELIRTYQDQFDRAPTGTVPGEFVAHAVERFTSLVATLNGTGSDTSHI